MKIIIIGGGGFVGSWLTHEFIKRKHEVYVIDPFIYYTNWDSNRVKLVNKFKKNELLKGAKIFRKRFEDGGEKILSKISPDIVIHLAGIPLEKVDDFDISLKQLTDDVGLTYRVIQAVKNNPVKKFVYMSSIAAYGDCDEKISEEFPLIPKTPYGIMKASGEFLTKATLDNWNVIRTTNIYGFGDLNGRAHNIIINKVLKNEKFWINSGIVLDFINVKDLVAGIADVALKADPKQVFHISGGGAVGLTHFVEVLKKHFSLEYEIKDVADRPKRGTMDNIKAKNLIGWSPKLDIEKGIDDYVKYVKQYKIS